MNWLILLASLNGFVGVAVGAFAAHALRDRLPPNQLSLVETGARYQLPHAVAALVVAVGASQSRLTRAAGWAFIIGSILFAGSLYALPLTGIRTLGLVTPFGGAGLLLGWSLLAVAGVRSYGAARH